MRTEIIKPLTPDGLLGNQVTIRSKSNPSYRNTIRKYQSMLVPVCFGAYEFVNEDGGACTVVQMRWKKG